MFTRSIVRASSRVATRPVAFKVARASITSTARAGADAFTPQGQIPTSSYVGGEVKRASLRVTGAIEGVEEAERVLPLSREVYESMPRNLQKMTLMDKVVVVTGYVIAPKQFAFELYFC